MVGIDSTRIMKAARALALLALTLPALVAPGCGSESGSSSNDESDGEPGVVAAHQPLATANPHATTAPMGSIQGTFSVDEKGGAVYSIPLTLPPGSNGVEPKLSLVYNSRQANGMLGMRVSLGGLSNITRCPRTKAIDGYHGTVLGDSTDRYCLDGQRLILTSGTYDGQDGAEYHTEIDNGSRVVSRGDCDGGPCRFEVTDALGNRAYYGYDAATYGAQNAYENLYPGSINTFAMHRLETPNGAYYTIDYVRDQEQIYPSVIKYTRHATVPLVERRVTFEYEPRTDVQHRAVNGTQYNMTKRLKAIRASVQGAGRVAREYRISYVTSPATKSSLIDTVSECDDAGVCLPPTRFEWKSDAQETFFIASPPNDARYYDWLRADPGARLITGDFNGDGKTDFIRQEVGDWSHDESNNFNVYLSLGDGTFNIVTPTGKSGYLHYRQNPATGAYEPHTPLGDEFQAFLSGDWGANVITGDFNGDGKTDFIRQEHGDWANDTTNNFNVYMSKGNGYFDVYTPTVGKGYKRTIVNPGGAQIQETPFGDEFQVWASGNYGAKLIPGDFNGDGKTDFIRQEVNDWGKDDFNNFNVYLSQGNGLFDIYRPSGYYHDAALSGYRGANIIPGDFNGDGKTDFIRQEFGSWDNDTLDTFSVYFSLENGRFDIVFPVGAEYQQDLGFDNGCFIIPGDFNGDGKTDFIRQERGGLASDSEHSFRVYFSRGDGYFDVVEPAGSEYQGWLRAWDLRGAHIIPIDWNNDGKMDFIRQEYGAWADDADASVQVYVSRGDGTFDVNYLPGWEFENDLRDNYDRGARIIPGDFDGDGKADFLRQEWGQWDNDFDKTFQVYFGKGLAQKGPNANKSIPAGIAPVDQAVVITNGLGGKINVTYAPLGTKLADPSLMRGDLIGMFVVGSTSLDDASGAAPVVREYLYYKPLFDDQERGFQGFQWVWERAPATGVETYSNYHSQYPFYGMLTSKATIQPGLGSKDEWRYYIKTKPYGENRAVTRVRLVADGVTQAWGTASSVSYRDYWYDDAGNQVLVRTTDESGAKHDECTARDVDVGNWRIDLPKAKWVGTNCWAPGNVCACETVLEKTEWTRDAQTNITTTKRMISGANMLSTTFTRDALGNVLTQLDPNGVTTTFTYDDEYRTFPMSETKSGGGLSETTVHDYDPRYGKRIYTKTPSGHERWTTIDGLGRETATYELDPSGASRAVTVTTRDPALKAKRTQTANDWNGMSSRQKVEYFDGFERVYKEETIRAGGNIFLERSHDELGRVVKESMPHLVDETPRFKTTKLDIFGQVAETVIGPLDCVPGTGCVKTIATRAIVGNLSERTLTEDDGTTQRVSKEWTDAKGRVRKRVDPDNRETTFSYDVFDHKTTASDGTSEVTISYDGLGNITQTSSMDRGTVAHTYSTTTGQLVSSNDNDQVISYQYDGLGRISVKTVAGKSITTYAYGTNPLSARGDFGRLSQVEVKDASAALQSRYAYSYDKAGRVTSEKVTIANVTTHDETYEIKRSYDPTGRPVSVTFPDNTTLTSDYLSHGPLYSIKLDGVIYATWTGHNAEGQPSSLGYMNGTSTTYGYDAARRLTTLRTTGPGSATLLDYTYGWNAQNRISGITDNRAGQSTRSQTFEYSAGGSLTRADGIYGRIDYEYDLFSNLTKKVEKVNEVATTTTYGNSGHRMTYVGSEHIEYSAGGDRLTSGARTFTYDGEHRLEKVKNGEVVIASFAYDYEGDRVLKIDNPDDPQTRVKTLYISKEYEVLVKADGTHLATKYLDGPAGRVAAVSATLAAPPTAMIDVEAPQNGVRAAFGVIMNAPRRLGAAASILLAMGLLALAYGLSKVRVTRAALRRSWSRARALLLPPATAWAKKHPVYAATVPLVILTFLSACAPGRHEESSTYHTEDALTAGANGAGNPIAGTYFFHQNHIGSASVVTRADGTEISRAEYKPYGELITDNAVSPGEDIFRAKFTGKELDNGTGLYYYGARYYDPQTGRFITADKYLHGGAEARASSLDPYAYSDNNPVMYTDPSGHFAFIFLIVAMGALVGGYMGAQAVNGSWDPSKWDWKSWKTWTGLLVGAAVGAATSYMGAQSGVGWAIASGLLDSASSEGLKFLSPEGNSVQGFFLGVAEGVAMKGFKANKGFTGKSWGDAALYAGKKAAKSLVGRALGNERDREAIMRFSVDAFDAMKEANQRPSRIDAPPRPEGMSHGVDWSHDGGSNAMLVVK